MKVFLFDDVEDSEFVCMRWSRLPLNHFLKDSGSILFPNLLFCAGAVQGLVFSCDRFICSQFSNVWAGFFLEYSCRRSNSVSSCSLSCSSSYPLASCSREVDSILLFSRDSHITMSSLRIPFVLPEGGLVKTIKKVLYPTNKNFEWSVNFREELKYKLLYLSSSWSLVSTGISRLSCLCSSLASLSFFSVERSV